MCKPVPDDQAEELAALLDSLMEGGTQHIDLTVGAETQIRTVNSTAFCQNGACAVPTLGDDDEQEGE